ncbi:MAG: aspartate/glutamate racemase family protein, partial [Clostridia bacterium]|nr:aspartate/glutamate racemase family protein [Clostridia bacterium]
SIFCMDMRKNGERPLITVFDSGIGGLNLLKECKEKIPQADFCYFADNFRVPYGNLPEKLIKKYVFEAFDKMADMRPDIAVVACNTVTSCCVGELRSRYSFPVAGVQPAVKQAAGRGGKFLVLATKATAESLSFKSLLKGREGVDEVVKCEGLAADIEKNIFSLENVDVRSYLPEGRYSSVVLGCTHYVFISDKIKTFFGCPVFDGIAGTADHVREILGIFDHRENGRQKIEFIGGDFCKNEAVFKHICR